MRIWSALLLVPVLGGCDLFSAEVKLDDACIELVNRSIDGTPGSKLVRSYDYDDLGAFDGFVSLDAKVSDLTVTLTAVSGVSDLSFLNAIHISMGAANLPTVDVVSCDDGACASQTNEASVAIDPPANLMDYVMSGKITINLAVEGALPKNQWTANLKVCLSGSASVTVY